MDSMAKVHFKRLGKAEAFYTTGSVLQLVLKVFAGMDVYRNHFVYQLEEELSIFSIKPFPVAASIVGSAHQYPCEATRKGS